MENAPKLKCWKKVLLEAISPVHPGTGFGEGAIDLPIQREKTTGYPIIFGQTLKGVIKDAYNKEGVETLFGKEDKRGLLAFSDAKILFFPVRSVYGVVAWISSPMVLKRACEDGLFNSEYIEKLNLTSDDEVIIERNSKLENNGKIYIEDFTLKKKDDPNILGAVAPFIAKHLPTLNGHVAIVSDDLFSHLVKTATQVVARIRIDDNTGTVKQGGLWYEEYLPIGTILYAQIWMLQEPGETSDKENISQKFEEWLNSPQNVFIGGNVTVGKGLMKIRVIG